MKKAAFFTSIVIGFVFTLSFPSIAQVIKLTLADQNAKAGGGHFFFKR
jgi:hypothetical protein